MRIWRFCTVVLALCTSSVRSEQAIEVPDPVSRAVAHTYNLEYEDARRALEGWLASNPNDLRALNLLANATLRQEMFREGLMEVGVYGDEGDVYKAAKMSPDPAFDSVLTKALDKAEGAAEARLATNPQDLEAMYWCGVSHGTRGIYNFTIKRSYVAALRESKSAVKFHQKLIELEPEATDPLLTLGVNNYVIGSLPWYVKMLAAMGGAHGDKVSGMTQIRKVTEKGKYARQDARFVLALLDMREGNSGEALSTLQTLAAEYPHNYLLLQEVAGVYRVRKEWTQAVATYDVMFAREKAGKPGFQTLPRGRLLYLAGQSASKAGERDRALSYYQQAAELPGKDIYTIRSRLEAANLLRQVQQNDSSRRMYQQVADETPDSDEGKLARKALQQFKAQPR
jgi:tetratricopeptide (TPR) repeat protein